MKKTLVLRASPNPDRYSYAAVEKLRRAGYEVIAVGGRSGMIADVHIEVGMPEVQGVDTVSLYIGPARQPDFESYILETIQPRRLIFNPGTENREFMEKALERGIEAYLACTLVMLSLGNY
jgi:predicted CoA-binding protein